MNAGEDPTAAAADRWYWRDDAGGIHGPLYAEVILHLAGQGVIGPTTWLSRNGGADWVPAGDLFGSAAFAAGTGEGPGVEPPHDEHPPTPNPDDGQSQWLWDHPDGRRLLRRDPLKNASDFLSGQSPVKHGGPGNPMTGVIIIYSLIIGAVVAVLYGILVLVYSAFH